VDRIAIVVRLKAGAEEQAAELIRAGPPFDPASDDLDEHTVYLSADEVVFVFEGPQVEWFVDNLVDDPFRWPVAAAFDAWRPLLDGHPRIARAAYVWKREGPEAAA
jgi:hypothetical protein